MTGVVALGQIGLRTTDPGGWRRVLTELIGMQPAEPDGEGSAGEHGSEQRFRADEALFRVAVESGADDELAYAAWEVSGEATLEAVAERLASFGVVAEEATEEQASRRGVKRLLRTADPSGYRVDLYHTPTLSTKPFVSPAGASFVTGALGIGHVVLGVADLERSLRFYEDALGLHLSDEVTMGETELVFLHCNQRHHSLALAGVGTDSGLLHFMVEMASLDEVGMAYERCLASGRIAATLGRHSNDRVLSFYLSTPSPWAVEVGCGGLLVDDASWRPAHHSGTSLWGHHPVLERG
jgi:2,3-dihydroxybiphenyl 1,2-dioxygenase